MYNMLFICILCRWSLEVLNMTCSFVQRFSPSFPMRCDNTHHKDNGSSDGTGEG